VVHLVFQVIKSKEISIQVVDQLPISTHKNVEVDIEDISKGDLEDKTKQVVWNILLNPRSEKKIQFKYKVTYPSDKQLKIE